MKFFKIILILFISVAIASCSDDSGVPTISLTNANLAGTYNVDSFNAKADVSATSNATGGIPVPVSTASVVGDTFQIDLIFNVNGSYSMTGQYRAVSTITPTGGSPTTNNSIFVIDNSGTYQINANNTITFNAAQGNTLLQNYFALEGTLNVITFNESMLILKQEIEEVVSPLTTEIETNFNFVRQ